MEWKRGRMQQTLVQGELVGDGSVQTGSIRNDTTSPDWVTRNSVHGTVHRPMRVGERWVVVMPGLRQAAFLKGK